MVILDSEDIKILDVIERKPYGAYTFRELLTLLPITKEPPNRRMEISQKFNIKLNQLVEFGLIRIITFKNKVFYCYPKAKI